MPERELAGQIAIVTGGASGIGRATALLLAEHGAAVAIFDRDAEPGQSIAKELHTGGARASFTEIDLSDPTAIAPAVQAIIDDMGQVDILVNSAGITGGGGNILSISGAMWDDVQAVNVRAPFLLMQAVGRHLIDRGQGGRIVNLSSSAAFRATRSPNHYAASKAAISSLSRTVAADLGPYGINVNAVAPGLTRTPMTQGVGDDEDFQRAAIEGDLANLLHRPSEPEDVAAVIVFLCLPASRQITGQTIHTSAGLVL